MKMQSHSVITSSKGPNKLCCCERVSPKVRCVIKVKENYLKTCRPAGILLNVNAMICFRFKLQLQFRNNKNYSSVIVNFHTGLC